MVEEKRGFIEDQFAKILFNLPEHPRLIGKQDEDGNTLLPSEGEQSPILIARVTFERLLRLGVAVPAAGATCRWLRIPGNPRRQATPILTRGAYFCSGCPHNTSTNVPDWQPRVEAGIGCHSLTIFMPERRTHLWSHMGGEGAAWIGQAPVLQRTACSRTSSATAPVRTAACCSAIRAATASV